MRFRWFAALAVMVLAGGFASAQPNNPEPTIELRLRSVNDLVDRFEYFAGLVGKENDAAQLRQFLKALNVNGKGIEGVDPKKPIGAYATLVKEVESSPFIIMIPIADEEQFLKMMKTRLDVTPEKNDDGTYKAFVPIINEMHLRFASDYLYVSPKAKDLDPKKIIKPADYFAKDDAAASLVVHIDRIPTELKTFLVGQFELKLNEDRKKDGENETAAEKQLKSFLLDILAGGMKGMLDDGKQLSVKFFIEPKAEQLAAEVILTAKDGSALAKNFKELGNRKSLPAGIAAAAANPIAHGSVKMAVTEAMKKEYVAAVESLLADVVKKAKPEDQEVVEQLVNSLTPTLKAGELDVAATLTGPDAKDRYQLLAAISVTEGKKIENFVKRIAMFLGEVGEFTFDIEKIGSFNLHRIDLNNAEEKFEKLFGTKSIWVGVSDKCIAISIEPDGKTIRTALKAKEAGVPVAVVEGSFAKLLPIIHPDLKPDELKALLKDAFGDGPINAKDRMNLTITGGNQLTVKFQMTGPAMRLSAGLDLLKGK